MNKFFVSFSGIGLENLNLNRVAISIFGFDIYWYAICITTGLIAAVLYGFLNRKRYNVSSDNIMDSLIWAIPISIILARVYYIIFDAEGFDSFWDMINIRDGGLAIYGGIIGAVIAGIILHKMKKINFLNMVDIASVPFLIGQAIGRWGNFFNAEVYGKTTNFFLRMTIKSPSGMNVASNVHPLFLYESLWNALGAVLLHIYSIKSKKRFKGQIALMYVAWYGIGRGILEGLRNTNYILKMFGVIPVSLVLGFLSATAAIVAIIIIKQIKKGEIN